MYLINLGKELEILPKGIVLAELVAHDLWNKSNYYGIMLIR